MEAGRGKRAFFYPCLTIFFRARCTPSPFSVAVPVCALEPLPLRKRKSVQPPVSNSRPFCFTLLRLPSRSAKARITQTCSLFLPDAIYTPFVVLLPPSLLEREVWARRRDAGTEKARESAKKARKSLIWFYSP